jgi:hypothetical protein
MIASAADETGLGVKQALALPRIAQQKLGGEPSPDRQNNIFT